MRLWSIANAVSCIGTWMQLVAQNLLVLEVTGSPALTGLSVAVQAAPGLLGVAGGALVDRLPRRAVVVASQVALAALALVTAVVAAHGTPDLRLLLVLGAATGLVGTVDGPACALLSCDLVPRSDVASAVAVGSVVSGAGRLVGTALAGLVVGALGVPAAYAANGFSFLVVAAVVPFLRLHADRVAAAAHDVGGSTTEASATDGSMIDGSATGGSADPAAAPASRGTVGRRTARARATLHDVLAGLTFLRRDRGLLAVLAAAAVTGVLGRNWSLTLAPLVTGPLHAGASGYGVATSVLAAGAIAGAVLAGRTRAAQARVAVLLAAVTATGQVVVAGAPSLALLLVALAPVAVTESAFDTVTSTLLMTTPPAAVRGRVLGAWTALSRGWGLAGPALLGVLLEAAGPRGGLALGGSVAAACCWALAASFRRWRTPEPVAAQTFRAVPRPRTARAPAAEEVVAP